MTSRQRGWLLIPSAFALAAGVFLGRGVALLLFPLAACLSALLAVLLLKGRGRFAACVVLSFAMGVFAGCLAFHPSLPPEDTYEVQGIISDEVSAGAFGQYRVLLSDLRLNGRNTGKGAYWTFYTDEPMDSLVPGKAVSFIGSLYHPSDEDNPGGFNFREYLLQRGIPVGLYGNECLDITEPDYFSFSGWLASLRHRLTSSLLSALGPETGAYASALLLGTRNLIPSEDRKIFSNLGIAHILCVSGFHVGILIGFLGLLFRLFRLRPWLRIGLYAVLLFLYAGICGMNQPVIRASLLLLVLLSGKVLNRPRSGLHTLAAVFMIMTLCSPAQITSVSFQLTFCSVFGLFFFQPLSQLVLSSRIRSSFLRSALSRLVLLFGIHLGILFPMLYFFQRLPLLGFLISIPATMVFSVLIVVLWVFMFLALPFPGFASLLAVPLRLITGTLLNGIRWLGSMPGLTAWIRTPSLLTGCGILLLFTGFCYFFRFRRTMRAVFLFAGTLSVVVSLLPVHHAETEYIQFSAGNADAAVLWDHDQVYVIDAGEADSVLSGYLRARRLTPDAVIITHLHADHAGGLRSLMEDEIPIPCLYIPYGADSLDIHPDFSALLEQLRSSGTRIVYLSRGDVLPLPSGTLSVLWPEKGKVRPLQEANHYSLVSRFSLNGSTMLHTGDISGAYEMYSAVQADLLKAAHHGSVHSTSPAYLSAVSPQAILLSCRQASRLESFRDRCGNIPVYGTPETGAVTVRFENGSFWIRPFRYAEQSERN